MPMHFTSEEFAARKAETITRMERFLELGGQTREFELNAPWRRPR